MFQNNGIYAIFVVLVLIHLICDADFNLVESIPVNNLQLIYNNVEDYNLQLTPLM